MIDRWLSARRRSHDLGEAGFTLVELIIAVIVVGVISATLVAVLGTSLRVSGSTSQKVKESNDAALISAYLVRDAQAAGGTDPTTAQLDPTLGVSTTDTAGCAAAGSVVVRFKWKDIQTWDANTHSAVGRVMVATYTHSGTQLIRRLCVDGSVQADVVLGEHVASTPPPAVSCQPVTSPACAGLPASVALTLTEASDAANPTSPYSYTLQATVRPQTQRRPSVAGGGAVIPLLALGGGICSGTAGGSGGGHAQVVVNGDVIANSTDPTSPCAGVNLGGQASLTITNGSLQVLQPDTCTSSGQAICPAVTSYGAPLGDPLAGLTPPPAACTGTQPAPTNAYTAPTGSLVFPQALSITSDTSFGRGIYVFCNGVSISSSANVSGTDVLWYVPGGTVSVTGQGAVTLAAATTGTYANVLIWVAASNQVVTLSGGSAVDSYSGLIYAPSSTVNLSGGAGTTFLGIIAKTITFSGGGTDGVMTLGPTTGQSIAIVAPSSLPNGTVNAGYPATTVSAVYGTTPYSWSATGLPTGLSINSSSGVISGTPTVAGTFTVVVTVSDATGATASRSYTLTVSAAPTITGPASLPSTTVNRPYPSTTVTASGGATPYTWSATGLPSGLSINAVTGAITGTPSTGGTSAVVVTVTDANGVTATASYSLVVNSAPSILTTSLGNWTIGQPYPMTNLTASGGTTPYTWSASGLPNGLSMSSTGVISGTPTQTGTKTVTVTLTDSAGATASATYSMKISAAPTITAPTSLVPWTVGHPYPTTSASVSNGTAPFTWSATGLPAGLAINSSTGTISGTPTTTGTSTVVITVTDLAGAADTQSATLVINAAPSITGPATLPAGTTGSAYPSTTVTASGGTTPRTWSATGLPPGLAIGAATGTISGTPTTTGSYSVTVTTTDAAGATASRAYTVSVSTPLVIAGPSSLPAWTVNRPYPGAMATATGGTPAYSWSATGLPSGLFINAGTGAISGTATTTGTFSVTITVTDSQAVTTNRVYALTINPAPTLITPATGKKNSNKTQQITVVANGTQSFTWDSIGPHAAWVTSFNADGTVTLNNTPSSGSTSIVVTLHDASGASVTGTLVITLG